MFKFNINSMHKQIITERKKMTTYITIIVPITAIIYCSFLWKKSNDNYKKAQKLIERMLEHESKTKKQICRM